MVLWEALVVRHEYKKYKESHHMPTLNQSMPDSTIWGSGQITTQAQDHTEHRTESDMYTGVGYRYALLGDTDSLNTSSAVINSVLQPQTKSAWYQDWPVGPYRKWFPASPPQSSPGYGDNTDPAMNDPRFTPRDEFMQSHTGHNHMRNDIWANLREHLIWIVLFIVVGSVLLQWGHWSYPKKEDVQK